MNDVGNLWECAPDKNTECKKTNCRACGGECWCTTNKAYSTGKRAILLDTELHAEYRRAVVRQSQRKRRALAKAVGLCSICCRRVHAPGRVTCDECNDRIKAYQNGGDIHENITRELVKDTDHYPAVPDIVPADQ